MIREKGMIAPMAPGPSPTSVDLTGRGSQRFSEKLIHGILFSSAAVSVATTVGIVAVLLFEALSFFAIVPIQDFLFGTTWSALFNNPKFGVLPLVVGTVMIAGIAICVAFPLGLASAIYLSEYAPRNVRDALKPAIEFLAGVPSIVYGYFALTFITPTLLQPWVPDLRPQNGLAAGVTIGIFIIPLIASLSEDAMRAVPRSLREGGYALGATKLEVSLRVVIPAAISGIVAATILAMSVAIGETMIVSLAAGAMPTQSGDPRAPMQTMTGYIVQVFTGDVSRGSVTYLSLFAVGLLLFFMTLGLNLVSQWFAAKFREEYE